MNKLRTLMLVVLVAGLFGMPVMQGQAVVGTTGGITAPANIKKGLMFYIRSTSLTNNAEYIVVPTASLGLDNYTFTADGTEHRYQAKASATGSLTITLYGAASGASSGSALDSIVVTISSIGVGVVSTDAFTDLLPWLIPIAIVIGLVGIFSIRKKLKAA